MKINKLISISQDSVLCTAHALHKVCVVCHAAGNWCPSCIWDVSVHSMHCHALCCSGIECTIAALRIGDDRNSGATSTDLKLQNSVKNRSREALALHNPVEFGGA